MLRQRSTFCFDIGWPGKMRILLGFQNNPNELKNGTGTPSPECKIQSALIGNAQMSHQYVKYTTEMFNPKLT